MRSSLVLLAQPVASDTPADAQVIQLPPELADPARADRLADAMQSMSQTLLDLKVGRLRAALEGREATRADMSLTVRDLARRDDPAFERRRG